MSSPPTSAAFLGSIPASAVGVARIVSPLEVGVKRVKEAQCPRVKVLSFRV